MIGLRTADVDEDRRTKRTVLEGDDSEGSVRTLPCGVYLFACVTASAMGNDGSG